MTEAHPVDVVSRHPRVAELGRNPREQRRVDQFATDLARWLFGEPREGLAPLARVVTVVAHRELRDPKRLCRGRSLLAVESAARATESLWPLLRGPLEEDAPEPEPPPPPPQGGQQAGIGGAGAGGDGDEEAAAGAGGATGDDGEQPQAEAEADADPQHGEGEAGDDDGEEDGEQPGPSTEDLLAAIAEEDGLDDPELQNLADRLRQVMGGDPKDEMELGAAAGQALSEATEAAVTGALESERVARNLEQFLPGVGWSYAPGQLHNTLLDRLDRLTRLIERLEGLDALADILGRLEDPSDNDGYDHGGSEEVVGVRLGGDVANALPSELALLGDEATEDLFYQRLLEHRLISLELVGAGMDGRGSGERRGPIIACIDTSGSMEGSPEMAAKALVLALCRKVLPEGRTVHLILFSGPRDRVELRLRRGMGGLEGLLDFLALSFRGGTDFDAPLARALALLDEQELNRSDILVVTDGLARASGDIVRQVDRAREQRGVRVYSVVLGDNDTFGVRPFSDEVWQLDPHGAAEAAGLLRRFQY